VSGDRRVELMEWAEILGKVAKSKIQISAYANNHYAGHGPVTVEMFREPSAEARVRLLALQECVSENS